MNKKILKNIIAGIFILLAFIATSTIPYIQNGDELWTFSNTYKLYNGISLYNENNVIVTPLFFWIGNILFKLFSATFLTYKIYNLLIIFALYLIVYKILKACKIKDEISIIITIISMFLYRIVSRIGANYTILALVFFMVGILNLIRNNDKKINIVFQGIITFLIFLTKQNIGIYYFLGLIVYILTKKEKIKDIIKLCITIIIPTLLFLGYEYYIGELYNFINYAFLGIGEFAQNNIIVEGYTYTQILIALQIGTIIAAITQMLENKRKNKKDEILKVLFIFSIVNMMLEYPIFNLYHVSSGIITITILLAYIIYGYVRKIEINQEQKDILKSIIKNILIVIFIVLIVLDINTAVFINKAFQEENKNFRMNDPFYGGIISEEESEYDEVMQFIKDKRKEGSNVIIFDIRANLYMIPLNENNQDYDLPMLGNWGKDGENRVLEDIKTKTNTYFLTYEETRNITTQESKKIKDYIKENSRNDGKIGKYDIYYKD